MIVSHTKEPTAMIFDIQHLCMNDGPGIRTGIFFKGCPLRCKWCHNPESYITQPQLSYNSMLCSGCLLCSEVCPLGACKKVKYQGKWILKVENKLCTGCGECLKVCCYDALELIGKRYTVSEVMEQIKIDMPYYEQMKGNSKRGGITLTGGEPMMQFEFIEELLYNTSGIHTCMETSGYANPENYKKIADRINLFLFDYKVTSTALHQRLCGVDNHLILTNLDLLYNMGADIILRLPLIPDINDKPEHFEAIAALLKKYPRIDHGEIMAYHNLGVSKAEKLGMDETEIDKKSVDARMKEEWVHRLKSYGAKNIIIG